MIVEVTMIGMIAGIIGTGLGGIITTIFKQNIYRYIDLFMGIAGGVMLAVVTFDLMKESMSIIGITKTVSWIIIGSVITMLMKYSIATSKDIKSGYLIFFSILMHNLPEGLAIGSSFVSQESLGITLAIVIGIHNIPEGLAMGLSLLGTGMNTKKIIQYTMIAGIPMGIGSFLGVSFAEKFNSLIGVFLAMAAGTMLYVVIEEIFPKSRSIYCIIGFLVGTIIVFYI